MQEQHNQDRSNNQRGHRPSRAELMLQHLSEAPTFREVAIYEAKKAAVWAPLLATTLIGSAWAMKKLLLRAAVGV